MKNRKKEEEKSHLRCNNHLKIELNVKTKNEMHCSLQ